jgi:hypothetical protein
MARAARRVLEITLDWAFSRYSFGRPLASYQEIKPEAASGERAVAVSRRRRRQRPSGCDVSR